jgi:hypothetical protein
MKKVSVFVLVGLAGFHDGAGKNKREANAEDKDNGIEHTEENGVVGLPEGQFPGEGALVILTV